MPSSNPVYQPTTVTYERHKEWSSSFAERAIPGCYHRPHLHRLLLISAILLAMLGLSLAVFALVNDANTHKDEDPMFDSPEFEENSEENFNFDNPSINESKDEDVNHDHETNVVVGSIGIALILVSLVMYVVYLQLKGMCRGLLPHSVRPGTLDGAEAPTHSESGIATAVSYKGVQQEPTGLNLEPAAPVEEERHSLMDDKFQSNLDVPPSIPKRRPSPPSRFRRGRIGAPLASQETLSPSLTSSFCSDIDFFDGKSSSNDSLSESHHSQEPTLCLQPSPALSQGGQSI